MHSEQQQQSYWNADAPNWKSTLTHQPWTGPNAKEKETFDYGHVTAQQNSDSDDVAETFDYNHRNSDQVRLKKKFSFDLVMRMSSRFRSS